jgi:RNA ligase
MPDASVSDLLVIAKTLPRTEEGFVLRFANCLRLKVKGDEYCRIHRLVSNLTPLSIWEAQLARDDLDKVRRELPEEFWDDFDQIRLLLQERASAQLTKIIEIASGTMGMTDKEVGLSLDQYPADVRSFIFPWRKSSKDDSLEGRTRKHFFDQFRPTGNHLEGYQPSRSINCVFEEAA